MRFRYTYFISFILLLFLLANAVLLISTESAKMQQPFRVTPMPLQIPKGWPKPSGDIFADNKPTREMFSLGKKLFYDGNLSKDSLTSCGSCHQQFAAFSTYDHDLSHGVTNSFTTRNAPALYNLAWMTSYHWDGGVANLEMQPLNPLTAPNEMGESLENVLLKIETDKTYKAFYQKAFGDASVTSARTLKALAQFVGQLLSANSKYDRVKAGKDTLTKFEANGYRLFQQHCSSCHTEPLFTTNGFANNGLTTNRFKDYGRMLITGNAVDSLVFKIPSLRNIQLSYPYMHDGRFYAMDNVLDHYMKLDTSLPNLDKRLKKPIRLSPLEKNQLIYFLYTLTDTSFTKNKSFAPDGMISYKH